MFGAKISNALFPSSAYSGDVGETSILLFGSKGA